jgi:hypothetical protein
LYHRQQADDRFAKIMEHFFIIGDFTPRVSTIKLFTDIIVVLFCSKDGATTFSKMTLRVTTVSIMVLFVTISIMTLDIESCYAECPNYLNVMLTVIMLNVIFLIMVAPAKIFNRMTHSRVECHLTILL